MAFSAHPRPGPIFGIARVSVIDLVSLGVPNRGFSRRTEIAVLLKLTRLALRGNLLLIPQSLDSQFRRWVTSEVHVDCVKGRCDGGI